MRENLLATREASHILGISEKDVIELAEINLLPHFKVAGEFLRFKREDVVKLKSLVKKKYNISEKKHRKSERIKDFFYFNDFYIITAAIIIALLWAIVKDITVAV